MNVADADNPALALLTKRLVVNCVRNTILEEFHAGKALVSHTGDGTDIRVIDADGREFAWPLALMARYDVSIGK